MGFEFHVSASIAMQPPRNFGSVKCLQICGLCLEGYEVILKTPSNEAIFMKICRQGLQKVNFCYMCNTASKYVNSTIKRFSKGANSRQPRERKGKPKLPKFTGPGAMLLSLMHSKV